MNTVDIHIFEAWALSSEHVLVHWITNSDNIQDHHFYPVNVIAILSCDCVYYSFCM